MTFVHRSLNSTSRSLMIAVGIVVATGCWLPETAWGQARTATSGIDAYGYSIFDQGDAECGYQFVDIAGSGTPVTLTASGADPARDDGGAVIALNDSFEFYGVLLTSLVLSSNGYLGASSSLAQEDGGDLSNDPYLPAIPGNGSATVARLLAFHDELSGEAAGGNTRAEYFAVCPRPSGVVAGEACTVIQWSGWGFLALPGTFDFQAILYHTSHAIVFQGFEMPTGFPGANRLVFQCKRRRPLGDPRFSSAGSFRHCFCLLPYPSG